MKDNRELLRRELIRVFQALRQQRITAGLKLVPVELFIRECQNIRMRSEVLDELHDPIQDYEGFCNEKAKKTRT